jgi:tRNA nucleotidyltransferase/poly(A) polymerase
MSPKSSTGEMSDFASFIKSSLSELLLLVPEKFFLVGGFVRERLLNKQSVDFDFAIAKNTIEIARELARRTKGVFVLLDEQRETARVVWNHDRNGFELNFDIARIIGKTIEEDLILRDLTINAIAVEVNNKTIPSLLGETKLDALDLMDPSGGVEDINNKIIRTYQKENFLADPLRILRTFRFAGKLGFRISNETIGFIREIPELIIKPAKERVLKEIYDIFSVQDSYFHLELMNEAGILKYLFHDLGNFAEANFLSGLNSLKVFETVIRNITEHFSYKEQIADYLNQEIILGHKKVFILKMVLLLNGLNPSDASIPAYLKQVEKFLKKFTFSAIELQLILKHLKFSFAVNEIADFQLSRKNLFHFFKDRQNEVAGSILLYYVLDFPTGVLRESLTKILEYYFEDQILSDPPQLLDGNDLIKEFNLKPSKLIGQLLSTIQEAQAERKVKNYEEAIEFVRGLLKET